MFYSVVRVWSTDTERYTDAYERLFRTKKFGVTYYIKMFFVENGVVFNEEFMWMSFQLLLHSPLKLVQIINIVGADLANLKILSGHASTRAFLVGVIAYLSN